MRNFQYRIGDVVKKVVRPTKTREQMDFEFQLIKARIPARMRPRGRAANQSRVIDCD